LIQYRRVKDGDGACRRLKDGDGACRMPDQTAVVRGTGEPKDQDGKDGDGACRMPNLAYARRARVNSPDPARLWNH